jgi:hypothetical protein
MIRSAFVPVTILATSIAVFAAPVEADPAAKQLQVYPKNLARQHLGANVFLYNTTSQSFTTTEAAAAWLDDDVTTGWAPLAGQQHYLLALPEPEVVTNFQISGRAAQGTVTIYGGDEPAAPGAKSWVPLARDVSLETINQKKLARPFSRLAKYILVETNIAEPAPLYSLYLYGDRPATSYTLLKRDQPIDTKAIFGPYVNDQTSFSHTALYSGGRVAFSTEKASYTAWQKAIDDNPETGVSLIPTKDDAGMVLALAEKHSISRVAVLAGSAVKGKLDIYFAPTLPEAPAVTATGTDAVQQVSRTTTTPIVQGASLAGLTPAATIEFDGTNTRASQDLAGVEAGAILLRWTPENGTDTLALREINVFNGYSLADYALALTPEAIAELAENTRDGKAMADGKEPIGEGKEGKEPIGEFFTRKPYLPPTLGFPPPLTPRIPPNVSN